MWSELIESVFCYGHVYIYGIFSIMLLRIQRQFMHAQALFDFFSFFSVFFFFLFIVIMLLSFCLLP